MCGVIVPNEVCSEAQFKAGGIFKVELALPVPWWCVQLPPGALRSGSKRSVITAVN